MEIKKISYEDFMKNINFFKKNLAFLYDFYNWPINKEKSKEEIENGIFEPFAKTLTENKENGFMVVAVENEKLYSSVLFTLEKDNIWYMDSVYTEYSKRKQGLATKIIEFGLKQISGKCFLHVSVDNTPAISLYEKLGFKKDDSNTIEKIEGRVIMSKMIKPKKIKR